MTYQQPPMPYTPPPPPARRSPWWRRSWAVGVAAGIVGLIIGATAAASGSGKDSGTKAGPTVTATATATQTAVSTAPAPPAGTVTLKPTVIKTVATKTKTVRVVYTPPPRNVINDGIYQVGRDIPPGTYRTKGGNDCYYAVLNSSDTTDIATNNNSTGPQIATLNRGKYLELSGGCTWSRER